MIAAPLFHAWGFAHFTLAMGLCTTIVLKRRFDPEATLSLTAQHRVHGADRRAGDAAADPRARRRGPAAATTSRRSRPSRSRAPRSRPRSRTAGWTCSATTSTTSTARPRSRGRRSPRPTDLRAAPGTAGRPPRGTVVQLFDDDGDEVAPRRDRADLRRQRARVRGLHGRRQQGRDRRPALVRRRRPLRRRRAPVHRRPRRRHDRLGRRERLPRRGRGPARGPRRRSPRRPCSASRTSSSASGSRRSSCCARGATLSVDEVKRYVKENLAGYKVPRDVEFVDELPRTSTGKVLKRELKGRLTAVVCWRHASAYGRLRSRAPGAHLGRGPPARPARARRAVLVRRADATPPSRSWSPCGSTSRARPATAGRCGCASRSTLEGPCMRCLEPADAASSRSTRARSSSPGARDEELTSPTWTTTASSTSRRGRATRWRWRCRRRSRAGPTARASARSAARTSTTSPITRHEAEPDPRWAKLSEIRFD